MSVQTPMQSQIQNLSRQERTEKWGGFVLHQRQPEMTEVRLTGRLTRGTFEKLCRRIELMQASSSTTFLVLDARHLEHIPMSVAEELSRKAMQWRDRGVVALWLGLSRYLMNLLLLSVSREDQLPAFDDTVSLQRVLAQVNKAPAKLAGERLEVHSRLVH